MRGLFLILLATVLVGCANAPQQQPQERTVSRVYEVPGMSKQAIFTVAQMWVAENFRSAKEVIEYQDAAQGTIIGNGNVAYPCAGFECVAKSTWRVPFTMRIDAKDGRFRIVYTNIRLSWPASYSRFGVSPAYDGPVNNPSDFEAIKPALLQVGDRLAERVKTPERSGDW